MPNLPPHQLTPLRVVVLLCALLLLGLSPNSISATTPDPATLTQQVIELTNAERSTLGLPPLKGQVNLQDAAMWITADNAAHNTLSHIDSLGRRITQRYPDFGYTNYNWIGENLTMGASTAEGALTSWINSPGHYETMLKADFCEMGAGYAYNANSAYKHYWAQSFGCRFGVHPVVINREAATTSTTTVALYIYGTGWAQEVRLSNDGVNWSAWEPYQPERNWTLAPGSGTRTVYVELRNGSTVRSAQDSIDLRDAPYRVFLPLVQR
ncbi:MAG: CAP domain-containing protein [Candidatus Viridilinea halotolerans]|uniref:CAP domain-containing protein n=1 Tax=Candidatus Viridilinea halotolerans TaxID=2491704 RepID=A0A426TRE2_9CHLR|nr:MAG: CAP domain-containing protein [Candidatus Viridilinea halotolerans]